MILKINKLLVLLSLNIFTNSMENNQTIDNKMNRIIEKIHNNTGISCFKF